MIQSDTLKSPKPPPPPRGPLILGHNEAGIGGVQETVAKVKERIAPVIQQL